MTREQSCEKLIDTIDNHRKEQWLGQCLSLMVVILNAANIWLGCKLDVIRSYHGSYLACLLVILAACLTCCTNVVLFKSKQQLPKMLIKKYRNKHNWGVHFLKF